MGHGKWRAIDDHGYLEILRKPECGCQWWDNTVWLKKPGSIGIRNQQTSVSMSVYVCFHVWICTREYVWTCTHAHVNSHMFETRTHNCWILTGTKISSAMNQVSSEPLSLLFPTSVLTLRVPSWCLLDHPRPLGTGTRQHPPPPQWAMLGSCPQWLNSP